MIAFPASSAGTARCHHDNASQTAHCARAHGSCRQTEDHPDQGPRRARGDHPSHEEPAIGVQQPTWTNADERCSGHVEPDLRASGGNRCVEPNFSDMPLPCSEAVLSCRSRGDDVAYAQHVDSTMGCSPPLHGQGAVGGGGLGFIPIPVVSSDRPMPVIPSGLLRSEPNGVTVKGRWRAAERPEPADLAKRPAFLAGQ